MTLSRLVLSLAFAIALVSTGQAQDPLAVLPVDKANPPRKMLHAPDCRPQEILDTGESVRELFA